MAWTVNSREEKDHFKNKLNLPFLTDAVSADSTPPAAMTGKPGRALTMAETFLSATGRTALPETPPYVVLFSLPTAGQGLALAFNPIRPDTVLMAVTPSAPPTREKY